MSPPPADGAAAAVPLGASPPASPTAAWRRGRGAPSLPESHASVPVPPLRAGFARKLFAFGGPGCLVAVGYMDPGNWATDLAGGSRFGDALLSVVLASSLAAMLLQTLAAKLGIATGRDLAQACRDHCSRRTSVALWLGCEVAIAACDLAEVLGSAIALQLLFGLPLVAGVLLTVADVLLVLLLQRKGFRRLEAVVLALVLGIGACFALQLALARPDLGDLLRGLLPPAALLHEPGMLYLAVGILGATVMPHNLYLHSSIVQTRRIGASLAAKREALRYARLDCLLALGFAFFVNAAILVLSAAVFHANGYREVADIADAHRLLAPLLGGTLAATLFALALLASGQNATLTGTLAGQIVMEGFLDLRLSPWLRRLVTRGIALVPAVIATALWGEQGAGALLVASQVVLSLQLPFAVVPLVRFTSDRRKMGALANGPATTLAAWAVAALIVALNLGMLVLAALGR